MADVGVPVELAPRVRTFAEGHTLIGGSPTTVLRLSRPFAGSHSTTHLGRRMLATGIGRPRLDSIPRCAATSVTVVIPVHERPIMLDTCLASLAPLRVIVVDDGSRQADAVAAVTRRHGAGLIRLPVNVGPAGARNAGLAAVRTPLVAFVDSDVIVHADTILDLARHLADRAVSVAAPRVRAVSRRAGHWFERYESALGSLDLGAESAEVRPGTNVAYVPSACWVARVADLGPDLSTAFDAALRVGEDVDLCWRLVAAGRRIRYDADAVAHHQARTSISDWLGRKVAYGSSAAGLAQRHGDQVAPATLTPLSTLAAVLLLARSRWALPTTLVNLVYSGRRAGRATGLGVESGMAVPKLAAANLYTAARQVSALLVRHWWPVAAAALVCGRRSNAVRNLVGDALLVDGVATCLAHRRNANRHDPPLSTSGLLLGRALDNLAYGTGLWRGVVAARSARALLPRVIPRGGPGSAPRQGAVR